MNTFTAIESLVASRSLLRHPFYIRWSKGELTQEELKVYAKEYFHLVERIPGVVSRVRDRVTDPALKKHVEQNVREEQEHVELWKRFSHSLGVTDAELAAHEPSQVTVDAVQSLEQAAELGAEEGIAAVYALECELPAIATTKKQGLVDFYGLTSADAHAYFDEHIEEEKHLQVWRKAPLSERALPAAETSIAAQHLVLDAVCHACGIEMDC